MFLEFEVELQGSLHCQRSLRDVSVKLMGLKKTSLRDKYGLILSCYVFDRCHPSTVNSLRSTKVRW